MLVGGVSASCHGSLSDDKQALIIKAAQCGAAMIDFASGEVEVGQETIFRVYENLSCEESDLSHGSQTLYFACLDAIQGGMLEKIAAHPRLTALTLRGNYLNQDLVSAALMPLFRANTLKTLALSMNFFAEILKRDDFLKGIQENQSLTCVKICDINNWDQNGLTLCSVLEALQGAPNVQHLIFHTKNWDESGYNNMYLTKDVIKTLASCGFETLTFENTKTYISGHEEDFYDFMASSNRPRRLIIKGDLCLDPEGIPFLELFLALDLGEAISLEGSLLYMVNPFKKVIETGDVTKPCSFMAL